MARRLRGNRLTVRLDGDLSGACRRWLRAAKLGDTDAVVGLGVLLTDTNRAQACRGSSGQPTLAASAAWLACRTWLPQ